MGSKLQKIVNYLFEVGTLKKIIRGHRQVFHTNDLSDNIASHSHRVAVIGYFLAKEESADLGRVLQMCIFHDTPETRSGDQTWIHKRYVSVEESRILDDQLGSIDPKGELLEVNEEYQARKTLEAKVAKDADNLDQYLLVKEYVLQGNKEAEAWLAEDVSGIFYTETARKLYSTLIQTDPTGWTNGLYVNEHSKRH